MSNETKEKTSLRDEFMNVSMKVYGAFLLCLLLAIFLTACMSVGPSKKYVERSYKNANDLLPVFVGLIDSSTKEQLMDAVGNREEKNELMEATQNGIDVYKMGFKRKVKNWHFLIKSQYNLLRRHQKKIEEK